MSAAHQTTSAGQAITSGSNSWSHDATGADILIVRAGWISNVGCTLTATFNGVSMTSIAKAAQTIGGSYDTNSQAFYLLSPPSGSHTVALSYSSSANAGEASSSSYTSVNTSAALGTPVTSNSTATVADTITITDAVAGDIVIDCLAIDTGQGGVPSGNQTSRMNASTSGYIGAAQDAAGAGSVAMTWSWANSKPNSHMAVTLKQASGATTPSDAARRTFPLSVLQH